MQVAGKEIQVLLGGGCWTGYILENERNILFYPFKERIIESVMLYREMFPLHQL